MKKQKIQKISKKFKKAVDIILILMNRFIIPHQLYKRPDTIRTKSGKNKSQKYGISLDAPFLRFNPVLASDDANDILYKIIFKPV